MPSKDVAHDEEVTKARHRSAQEESTVWTDDKHHRRAIWSMVQDAFENAKTDPDCLAAAAKMGWGPAVFDQMKNNHRARVA